jgi:hypothetical protein
MREVRHFFLSRGVDASGAFFSRSGTGEGFRSKISGRMTGRWVADNAVLRYKSRLVLGGAPDSDVTLILHRIVC